MDQAQVAREIAHRNGWSTKFIRPLALWQIEKNTGSPATGETLPDTFNAPLPPLVNALPVWLGGDTSQIQARANWSHRRSGLSSGWPCCVFSPRSECNTCCSGVYFDQRLAFWAAVLTLLTDFCWEWTLSGLPQMLMLLLFNLVLYALSRAVQAQHAIATYAQSGGAAFRAAQVGIQSAPDAPPAAEPERPDVRPSSTAPLGWLALAGVLFGLLALSHALAIWLVIGAAIFCGIYFRPWALAVTILVGVFALTYSPWLLRTYRVSGSPFGVAGYALFDGIGTSTSARMRGSDGPQTEDIELYFFRPKIQAGITNEFRMVSDNLGGSLLAMMFFVSLLHPFRRKEVAMLRWAVLLMWLAAVFGMAFIGSKPRRRQSARTNSACSFCRSCSVTGWRSCWCSSRGWRSAHSRWRGSVCSVCWW